MLTIRNKAAQNLLGKPSDSTKSPPGDGSARHKPSACKVVLKSETSCTKESLPTLVLWIPNLIKNLSVMSG